MYSIQDALDIAFALFVIVVITAALVGMAMWQAGPRAGLRMVTTAVPGIVWCFVVPGHAWVSMFLFVPSLWALSFVLLLVEAGRPLAPLLAEPPPSRIPPKVRRYAVDLQVLGFAPIVNLRLDRPATWQYLVLVNPTVPCFVRIGYLPQTGTKAHVVFYTPLEGGTVETAVACYGCGDFELVQTFRGASNEHLYQHHLTAMGLLATNGLRPLPPTPDRAVTYYEEQRTYAKRAFAKDRLRLVFVIWRRQTFLRFTNVGPLEQQDDTPKKIATIRSNAMVRTRSYPT